MDIRICQVQNRQMETCENKIDRVSIRMRDIKRSEPEGLKRLDKVLLYARKDSKGRLYEADIELIEED